MQSHRLSNVEGANGRSFAMSGLPGKKAIKLPRHLSDQNALQITSGCRRKIESVNFLEHALNHQDGWLDLIDTVDMHVATSFKTKSPKLLA